LTKNDLRAVFLPLPEELVLAVQGKLAENLRRSEIYRQCKRLFVDPSLLLRQVRVNALLDGKELVMPAPGLKDGFYLLKPFVVPFKHLVMGVTYNGLDRYGIRLNDSSDIASLNISLLLGEAVAVDRQGGRLGDGQGFFDLAIALLNEMGGLAERCQVVAAIDDPAKVIESVPQEPWDVRCTNILAPDGIEELCDSSMTSEVFWDSISLARIKRISPLWKLQGNRK
jgi:5-formyltetrahydrofolate cyclo-ligase